MSPRFFVKRPIYPFLGLFFSLGFFVFGLLNSTNPYCIYYIIVIYLMLICFGYYKAALAVIPFLIIFSLIFGGTSYLVNKSVPKLISSINRTLVVGVAIIPGLAVPPIFVVRNMRKLKIPKSLVLGTMITLNFFPLFKRELKQVKEAMRARGVKRIFNFKLFYRAFFIPLTARIVNISDTLSISLSTRAFTLKKSETSFYKEIKFCYRDFLFLTFNILLMFLLMVL